MSGVVLNEGRPVFVETPDDRIGRGPWARWLATSVVPDEGSSRAERGRVLARTGYVHSVTIREGTITGIVIGSGGGEYEAAITSAPIPPRTWAAVSGSAVGKRMLAAGIEGREQSLQLEHVMTVDWGEPLIPPARAVRRTCTCPDIEPNGVCKHVAALAYVVADAVDAEPSLLLQWRGCRTAQPGASERAEAEAPLPAIDAGDPWHAGILPAPQPIRPMPVGAVLKRLGPSGLRVEGEDLADVLQRAYAAFARS